MLELDLKGTPFQERGTGPLAESPRPSLAAARTCGVLVVDDEAYVRAALNIALRQQGFAVWLAADGHEALALYRCHRSAIDVVVMDVRMPGLDGPQTLALLQKLNPRICCRFMSGDLGRYLEWKLSNLSSASVIRKPFRLPEVAQMLWKLAQKVNWILGPNHSRKEGPLMLSSYSVACPHQDCGWTGSLVPSVLRGGADAEIASRQRAWFQCPRCQRDWEVRITDDTVKILPAAERGRCTTTRDYFHTAPQASKLAEENTPWTR